jgi:hypothetical protein
VGVWACPEVFADFASNAGSLRVDPIPAAEPRSLFWIVGNLDEKAFGPAAQPSGIEMSTELNEAEEFKGKFLDGLLPVMELTEDYSVEEPSLEGSDVIRWVYSTSSAGHSDELIFNLIEGQGHSYQSYTPEVLWDFFEQHSNQLAGRSAPLEVIGRSGKLYRSVIIAVVAVGMMEVAVDQIVDMVSVRHRLMATTRPMDMTLLVPSAFMIRGAGVGILGADTQDMLIDMIAMHMMEMAIVKVVDVTVVLDGCVPTIFAVDVRVVLMLLAVAQGWPLLSVVAERSSSPACSIALLTNATMCRSASA